MDLSKLPKFSDAKPPMSAPPPPGVAGGQTSADPAPMPQPANQLNVLPYRTHASSSGWGPEAWISIGLGLILVFAFPHFSQWMLYAVVHTKLPSFLPITDTNGAEVPYAKSIFFMSDLCIALFAYALIIEGIVMLLARRPGMVMIALVVTSAAVLLNLYYVIESFSSGDGFALVSAVAVLVGGYMAMYQLRLMQEMKQFRAARRAPGIGAGAK